jgi:hypothetical protein
MENQTHSLLAGKEWEWNKQLKSITFVWIYPLIWKKLSQYVNKKDITEPISLTFSFYGSIYNYYSLDWESYERKSYWRLVFLTVLNDTAHFIDYILLKYIWIRLAKGTCFLYLTNKSKEAFYASVLGGFNRS